MSYLDRVFETSSEVITIPNKVVFSGEVDLSSSTLTGLTLTASVVAPDADDGAALGSTALKWSDLFLASGAVINFNNGDVTITHSSNTLTIAGGDLVLPTITISTGIVPDANDGAYLGQSGTAFSDLFLASGAVINFDASDVTITHGSNVLTIAGGSVVFSGGAQIADDQVFTLGTTVATAATKITLEFDETTTGIGIFSMGSIAVPMVLNTNPGATVVGQTVNILHSAGAGDCDDLLAVYNKVAISGDGDSGLTAVGHAARAYVGTEVGSTTVVAELYGSQPWVSHFGTGAVTAMSALSAKCDVNTGNFTASTVNAGHFHVEGAATVTAQFDGVMIEIYPDVTCLDSMLALAVDTGATVTSGIRATGAFTNLFSLVTGAGCTHGGAAAAAVQGYLTISVGGNPYRIPYLADSDS